jgi:hypothetical protein
MTWLVWRQYRATAASAGSSGCLQQQAGLVNGVVSDLPYVCLVVPVVLGMLWGAPLVASELEARTTDFCWTQSITRTRWLAVKAGWLLLAAVACGGAVSALATWWSGPINAESATAFTPGQFDVQGIVPLGYAVFAMAIGIAVGTVTRRVLPAIAVVLGGFIAVRLLIENVLRPHYMAAVTTYYNVTGSFTPTGQAWVLAQGAVSGTGQRVAAGWGDLFPALPAACQRLLPGAPAAKSGGSLNAVFSCMAARGWRGFATYQPADRYWPFQGIETGVYVLLAAALIAATFAVVRRRDA